MTAPTPMEADLRSRLDAADAELALLREELETTNQGVVALYAELDDRAEQLKSVSELKSRFLSYVSHEFRTPLGAIRSITTLLLREMDGPLNDEQRKQVSFIQKSIVELSEMVNDQLDLARLEAGRITISPVWFEMVDLFTALRGMFKPILVNEDVTLVFQEPSGVTRMHSDDRKLAQILRNFISNALKFTPKGSVVVRAAAIDATTVEFSVTDTGIGVPAEFIEQIFQDFIQVDSTIQRRVRGSGLGLALSRRLAQLLGGDVSVESTVGAGSTFRVRIPIALPGSDNAT